MRRVVKKIGIVGGIGPESTLYYYRAILDAFKADYLKSGYPEMVIESLDLKQCMDWAEEQRWDLWIKTIVQCLENLQAAGADFGVIASNTPHKYFADIQSKTKLELISIVTETCTHIGTTRCTRPALWGTRYTMESDFYPTQLKAKGIQAIVPNANEQAYIQDKLFSEIELGIIRDQTRQELMGIIQIMKKRDRIDSVILACTELPLILSPQDIQLPCFDTAAIHVASIVQRCKT
jgi:aspartate racemase